MAKKSVLLLGSYGHSNIGDDLLMWNYLALLKRSGVKKIYANANTTDYISKSIKTSYPELTVIDTYRTSLLGYVKLIKKVDYIVYGGGTLYKELYASTGRSPYSVGIRLLGFNLLAKLLRTPLYHLHIGIGSLTTWRGRMITKWALEAATYTIFRDHKSYAIAAKDLRVSPIKIAKSTDGLFLNPIWKKPWQHAKVGSVHKKYSRVVGINVLSDIPDWVDRENYIAVMRSFVHYLHKHQVRVLFVPFQTAYNPRNDLAFIDENFGDLVTKGKAEAVHDISIETVVSALKQCDVFVGMRFHSLLLCTAAQVPFVAIAYDTKCWRFTEEVEYTHALRLEEISLNNLIDMYEAACNSQKELTTKLSRVSLQLYDEAKEGIRTLRL